MMVCMCGGCNDCVYEQHGQYVYLTFKHILHILHILHMVDIPHTYILHFIHMHPPPTHPLTYLYTLLASVMRPSCASHAAYWGSSAVRSGGDAAASANAASHACVSMYSCSNACVLFLGCVCICVCTHAPCIPSHTMWDPHPFQPSPLFSSSNPPCTFPPLSFPFDFNSL